MVKARIQPFCRANNNTIGFFDGTIFFPRMVTEKNIALYKQIDHFCLICISQALFLNKI